MNIDRKRQVLATSLLIFLMSVFAVSSQAGEIHCKGTRDNPYRIHFQFEGEQAQIMSLTRSGAALSADDPFITLENALFTLTEKSFDSKPVYYEMAREKNSPFLVELETLMPLWGEGTLATLVKIRWLSLQPPVGEMTFLCNNFYVRR